MDDFGDTDLYLEHIEGDVDDDEDEGNTTTQKLRNSRFLIIKQKG